MKLIFFILSLLVYSVTSIVIQPQPTPTANSANVIKRYDGTPTAAPRHIAKRDIDETLSLYEFWADECNNKDNYANVAVSDVNNLWQTTTTTIYCGNNRVKTVTKTITKSTGSKSGGSSSSSKKKVACDDKCWSNYLWHTYGYGITVAQGFTGIVLMLIGLYFIVFGFSCFRATLALTGFVFFALMTWIGLVNNEPMYGYPHNEVVYICVSVGIGLIGAFLFFFLFNIAIYFIGVVAGIFLAVFILSWRVNLVIQIVVARICFIVGMGVVFGVLLILAESYVVLFCTGFTGAYLFILGLDLFIHTGLINAFLSIFDSNKNHTNVYILKTPTYVMLSFVIVLTLASFGWQYYWNLIAQNREFGVEVVEKKPPEEEEEKK